MGADLVQELQTRLAELDEGVRLLRKAGTSYAKAERDYKIELRKACLKMRDEGLPATLIDKTCYGAPKVADLRFRRDCCEAVWKASLEGVNATKLQIRVLNDQVAREW